MLVIQGDPQVEGYNLVEFDYEELIITRNAKSMYPVLCIEKVSNCTFLTGCSFGEINLISKQDLTCLNKLNISKKTNFSDIY